MKTQIQRIDADWKEVKNECRSTTNKAYSDKDATPGFIKKILIAEHSPIRLIRVKWRWEGIKSFASTHFARHWLGWNKWISTQRSDRTGINRDNLPQGAPVNYDGEANAQALINVARARLCFQADPYTRSYMEDLKASIKNSGQEALSNVMVPNCIYRGGCPEFTSCGYYDRFIQFCIKKFEDEPVMNLEAKLSDIQTRYDLYNEYFYQNNFHK